MHASYQQLGTHPQFLKLDTLQTTQSSNNKTTSRNQNITKSVFYDDLQVSPVNILFKKRTPRIRCANHYAYYILHIQIVLSTQDTCFST